MSRPTTTADTSPISPARFAAALPPLSLPTLHLKVLEIRNSIAHLRTSNIELLPYALGTEPAGGAPDPDCADAIRENEAVILRMDERIALIRAEVEDRGRPSRGPSLVPTDDDVAPVTNGLRDARLEEDAVAAGTRHPAWSDGTFQTGTIRGGVMHFDGGAAPAASTPPAASASPAAPAEAGSVRAATTQTAAPSASGGGRLDDEQLRRAMEERMRQLDDDDGGMHL
ncbi:uncharacterized protein VDAG_03103 [Verticillium dahliae VdLs.17]|uniref:Secondary alcohol dehydrogenase n=1 Tax=Verticillium dahliae (strain VdLs.17 / ATCC MYA-4575 / FGSC 10137) TaxID=498257 RepID=G2WYL1_VERDV|nr:uncharacterized protein VDAG_03103 [Verticillium dahliae VdLs.17]EGY21663.1 hypothetical protein VDAG_03103 [Verticillium dahliae VdLs.17]